MLHILKRLMRDEPLPPYIHFHLDEHGNDVWCDSSVCRPPQQPTLRFPPRF